MKTIRIFISSPGDVGEERQRVENILERLQGKYWSFVRLEGVFWETKAVRSTAHYQDELPKPSSCDIVIGIFWWRLGSPLPQRFRKLTGDRYHSGTEWELEEAFEGYERSLAETHDALVAKPDIIVYRRNDPRPSFSNLDEELDAVSQQQKLDDYIRREYLFPDGTIKRPLTKYAGIDDFDEKLWHHLLELILRRLPKLKSGYEPPPVSGSPFKGLESFGFYDSDRYFGRNREVHVVQNRLIERASSGVPFILIYGGSGYGKSSLMKAGVSPKLTQPGGSLDGIRGWRRSTFQASKGDGSLCERLVSALIHTSPKVEESHSGDRRSIVGIPELLEAEWPNATVNPLDPKSLALCLSSDTTRNLGVQAVVGVLVAIDCHLLIELDQLEEIFTDFSASQRTCFLKVIHDLCVGERIWVIATMRSEFFPRIAEVPELLQLVGKDGGYILSPPGRQSLRDIIRLPAMAARLNYEQRFNEIEIAGERSNFEQLDEQILGDAEGSPDVLPLLEFTLQNLYENRDGDFLTWAAYRAVGGLKGAIGSRAKAEFEMLSPSAKNARHRLFSELVKIDAIGNTIMRKRASLSRLEREPALREFLQGFLQARLLTTCDDLSTGGPVVMLVHEALISHWDDLSNWIGEHRDDLLARHRLSEQADLWTRSGNSRAHLLSEARLIEAERIDRTGHFTLTTQEALLLKLSRRRAKSKVRFLQVAVTLFALIAIVAGLLGQEAQRQATAARTQSQRAENEKAEAIQQKGRAVFSRNQAEDILGFLLYELHEKLEPLGRTDIVAEVEKQVDRYYENLGVDDSDPAQLRERSVAQIRRGAFLVSQGDLEGAAKQFKDATDITRRLANSDPDNIERQRGLGTALIEQGKALVKLGRRSEGTAIFQECLEIYRKITLSKHSTVECRHDLSVVLVELGILSSIEGRLTEAIGLYKEALGVSRELLRADPENRVWQNDVIEESHRLGDALVASGDLSGALDILKESLDRSRVISEADRRDAGWQRSLSISLNKVADVMMLQGGRDDANRFYVESLEISERLAKSDPANVGWQRDLEISYQRIGDVLMTQGKLEEALKVFGKFLSVGRELAIRDPENMESQRDLAVAITRVGDVEFALDRFDAAGEKFREAVGINRRMLEKDSSNNMWRRDLAIALDRLGDVFAVTGNLSEAGSLFEESLSIRREQFEKDNGNVAVADDLNVSFGKMSDLLRSQGHPDKAIGFREEAIGMNRSRILGDPSNTVPRFGLALSLQRIGDLYVDLGTHAKAIEAFREGVLVNREIIAMDPANLSFKSHLGTLLDRLGDSLLAEGDEASAFKAYNEALENSRKISESEPRNYEWKYNLGVSLGKIGKCFLNSGRVDEALVAFNEQLLIDREIARVFPDDVTKLVSLVVTLWYLGTSSPREGDGVVARKHLEEGLGILKGLRKEGKLDSRQQGWMKEFEQEIRKLGP